jgi:centriolar protein POC1
LLSTSLDGTLKIWDLRRGTILYTLYGHEGETSSGSFSPAGDYFATGGKDSVILVWKSNMSPHAVENLTGLSYKVPTEVFLTDKKEIAKIPEQ